MSESGERDSGSTDDWLSAEDVPSFEPDREGGPERPEGEEEPTGAETENAGGAEPPAAFGDTAGSDDPEVLAREERRLEREQRRREADAGGDPTGRHSRSAGLGGALARLRGALGGGSRDAGAGEPEIVATGRARGSASSAVILRRRLAAGGAVIVVLALVVVAALAVTGGGDEPEPVVAPPTMSVTIPEGLDRAQIADLAKEEGVRGNYKADSKSSKRIKLSDYGAKGASSLEGFLFPSTYELNENGTTRQLVTRQIETFKQRIKPVSMKYARSKNLTTYDILKIASMIEREVMVPTERKLVAAVIYNRLSANEPLAIDSTIRFEDGNYKKQLTAERLATDSAYNTRTRAGLPPTPIGNPGLAAIKAAANPDRSDIFYFVVKPGTCGEHVFTASQKKFDQAAADYQRALEREGGSPTECPE